MTGAILLERLCRENGVSIDGPRLEKLGQFVGMLIEWNSRVNLISRRDTGNIWISHIFHALIPWRDVVPPSGAFVLDLGTGGGLPGLPLAILREDLQVTLLDSIAKKTVAVEDMVRRLRLVRARVLTGRAEVLGKDPSCAGRFDLVVARAVAPLYKLLLWSRPLLRKHEEGGGGWRPCLVAMKGGDLQEEVELARLKTGARDIEIVPLRVRGAAELAGKVLVIVRP